VQRADEILSIEDINAHRSQAALGHAIRILLPVPRRTPTKIFAKDAKRW
jgi:hypothetical protein